ncbi:hypothetical protein GCM10023084_35990 [Streptomyces lacrimifluminis]|uniref:Uncharacterized protein n=1 Tax=Streptomyces lacrimifluminis TaxID=1500077 RepID=A0A917NX24_9ACTN|nr:hypothetical protein GCM10012282_37960 [Streptomyces lacrimifluminis]
MHLLEDALAGQRVEVTADRHVRHAELAGQLVDANAPAAPYLVQDQGAALLREEVLVVIHDRSTSFRGSFGPVGPLAPTISDTSRTPAANLLRTRSDKDIPPANRPADVPYSHGPVLVAPLPVTTRTCHSGNTGSSLVTRIGEIP